MTGKTHLMGGLASTVVLTTIGDYEPILFLASGIIGGLLPDICHSQSKIGRKFRLLSKLISMLFGHRTFTHSLLFLFLVGLLLSMVSQNKSIITGLIIGMISHFVLDAATKKGIKLFYPLNITVRFPFTTKTGSTIESIIFVGLTFVTIYYGKDIIFHLIN